ncbi:23599_t:CDS:2 [Entrophospora sp. SA101]|nr:11690_t:CDS:2 [Entrophospora sp. SA101]CAJ0626434.1 16479_t:CDS:2 [Entrophospora sp. SA101]CAJ0747667.1 13978_t:CDS:2 [Entrophospora sp. SA101]CAJ0750164.1 23599_t:CDS:2 [Entrophospora sp. SA101]CAJ0836474.1 677_t:CDS:2 [Entrophospora sp. SA101]
MFFLSNYELFFEVINNLTVLLITFISLSVFRYYYLYFTRENPLPGPFPLPLVGSIHHVFYGDLQKYFLKVYQKYGDLTEVWFADFRIILTSREDYIESFVSPSTKSKYSMRNPYIEGLDEFLNIKTGVIVNHDYKSWKFNRMFLIKTIAEKKLLDETIESLQEKFKEMNGYWNDLLNEVEGETLNIDFIQWIQRFVTDNILPSMTGKKSHSSLVRYYYYSLKNINNASESLELESLLVNIKSVVDGVDYFAFTPYIMRHYVPIIRNNTKVYLKNRDCLWEKFGKFIVEKKKEIEKIESKDKLRYDILTALITANTDKDMLNIKRFDDEKFNRPLTNEEIRGVLVDVFFAGVDTTSNFFTAVIYYIGKHPMVLKKLHEEIDKVFFNNGGINDNNIVITQEKLSNLVYCEAIIKETARLSPINAFVDRINTEKDTIKSHEWPTNTVFLMNTVALNLDPLKWENPNVFDPDRFFNNKKDALMFGGGHRICPGRKLAMVQMKCLLVLIYHYWDVELVNKNEPLKGRYLTIRRISELLVRIKPRKI